eukprot:Selendium_serpulae@DN5563_c0_g2_i2.p1
MMPTWLLLSSLLFGLLAGTAHAERDSFGAAHLSAAHFRTLSRRVLGDTPAGDASAIVIDYFTSQTNDSTKICDALKAAATSKALFPEGDAPFLAHELARFLPACSVEKKGLTAAIRTAVGAAQSADRPAAWFRAVALLAAIDKTTDDLLDAKDEMKERVVHSRGVAKELPSMDAALATSFHWMALSTLVDNDSAELLTLHLDALDGVEALFKAKTLSTQWPLFAANMLMAYNRLAPHGEKESDSKRIDRRAASLVNFLVSSLKTVA